MEGVFRGEPKALRGDRGRKSCDTFIENVQVEGHCGRLVAQPSLLRVWYGLPRFRLEKRLEFAQAFGEFFAFGANSELMGLKCVIFTHGYR